MTVAPRLTAEAVEAPADGRQSEAALAIARGTGRLLVAHGMTALPELVLPTGRRADLVALSAKGEIWIVEIKSSVEDFRADQKWPEYATYCDRFFFAVNETFPDALIPHHAGLIVADRYGAELIRESPLDRIAPNVRRQVTLAAARAAAARLHVLHDPEAGLDARLLRE